MRGAALGVVIGLVLWACPAEALSLCAKRSGVLLLRAGKCTRKQTAVALASLLPQPAVRWALVDRDGTILAQSGGISVSTSLAGLYVVGFGESLGSRAIQATSAITAADNAFRGSLQVGRCGGGLCPPGMDTDQFALVGTLDQTNTIPESHPFFIVLS